MQQLWDLLYQRLVNDYRSTLLGNSKKLTFSDNSAKLKDYPIKYSGCFYCEKASNGEYTSTECEVFGYDENVLPSIYNWLNNLVFPRRYVCIRKAKLDEYLIGGTIKNQYNIGSKQVTFYEKQGRQFILEFYENGLIMIKTADVIQNKGFVDVT